MAQSTNTIAPSPEGGNRLLSNDTPPEADSSQIGTTAPPSEAPPSGITTKVAWARDAAVRDARCFWVTPDPTAEKRVTDQIKEALREANRAQRAALTHLRAVALEYVIGNSKVDAFEDLCLLIDSSVAHREMAAYVNHIDTLVRALEPHDVYHALRDGHSIAGVARLFTEADDDARDWVDSAAYIASKETGEVYDDIEDSDERATPRNRELVRAFMLRRIAELRSDLAQVST